jgi:putative ABC transport system permease protein
MSRHTSRGVGHASVVLFWPGVLPRAEEIQPDWQVFVVALAAALASGLLFGTASALRASRRELENALQAGSRTVSSGSRRMHGLFVTGEPAWALVLLVAAGMLRRTLLRLSSLDPGVNLHNVLTARVEPAPGPSSPAAMRVSWQEFLERTRHVPGVTSAALADIIPMRAGENELGYATSAEIPPPERIPLALSSCVTPDYREVVGLTLHQGRFFTEQDRPGSEAVVVIDDVMAEHAFGGTKAVGRRLWVPSLGPEPVHIVNFFSECETESVCAYCSRRAPESVCSVTMKFISK